MAIGRLTLPVLRSRYGKFKQAALASCTMKVAMVRALEASPMRTDKSTGNKLFVASDGLLKSAEEQLAAAGGIKNNCTRIMESVRGIDSLKTIFLWRKGMDAAEHSLLCALVDMFTLAKAQLFVGNPSSTLSLNVAKFRGGKLPMSIPQNQTGKVSNSVLFYPETGNDPSMWDLFSM